MTFFELRQDFHKKLNQKYQQETDNLFFILLEFCTKMSKIDYFLSPQKEILPQQKAIFENFVSELKDNKPIQYLLNEAPFFGMSFYVDENVLIPRQETEELVDWIINEVDHTQKVNILDIGTGSGCIAISLAKYLPKSKVYAIDISEKALQVAQRNAQKNGVSIDFLKKDILKIHDLGQTYDIIVSNPPYVRELEKKEIASNVMDYEPHIALFVEDNNPLVFYDKITDLAKYHLTKNGKIFFEINQYLSEEMLKLLEVKKFADVLLRKDICGNNRMIRGIFVG